MADFSFLSDTDDSAVDEILSEAADLVALKQISALNLASASDSVLPQHLESRFRRLKTFPSSQQPLNSAPELTESTRHVSDSQTLDPKSRSGSERRRLSRSSSSESSNSWLEAKDSPELKSGSVSPPPKRKTGCLWCSPKRALRKMSFSKRGGGNDGVLGEFGKRGGTNDGVLEEFGVGSISRREQERILKRAVKEEMRINEEAEKIVKWAKQVSSRMETFGLEDDDDHERRYK